jgi:hypothetical protein
MAAAHDEQQPLVAQFLEAIAAAVCRGAAPCNGQVDAPLVQQAQDLVAGVAHDAQAQLQALRLHAGHGSHHQVGCCAHDGADGQVAVAALAARGQVLGAAVDC